LGGVKERIVIINKVKTSIPNQKILKIKIIIIIIKNKKFNQEI